MTPATQKTLADLIKDARITLKAERTDTNPNMEPVSRGSMDHWKVKLTRPVPKPIHRFTMTTYFSMGFGHNGAEPDVAGVLDCLLSDSDALDRDFEDWASELGFDADSRRAEKTYKACLKSGEKLKTFLGDELFERMRYAER